MHSFGNLCIVISNQNSVFGNLYLTDKRIKLEKLNKNINEQSLKLQMMAYKTKEWGIWDETKKFVITQMERELLKMLNILCCLVNIERTPVNHLMNSTTHNY